MCHMFQWHKHLPLARISCIVSTVEKFTKMMTIKDEILNKIEELEQELDTLNLGDYSYDVVNSELEYLYGQLKNENVNNMCQQFQWHSK